MASSSMITIILALLSIILAGVSARPGVHFHPCNTLYVSYTLTSTDLPHFPSDRNPSTATSRYFAVFRITRPVRFYPDTSSSSASFPLSLPRPIRVKHDSSSSSSESLPYLGISISLRERAKDILVVLMGLLFGVGCGALTAATMYLAWSLLTNRYEVCGYGYVDEDDEIESQKKMGYASIPPAPATPSSPVKEGYEGN